MSTSAETRVAMWSGPRNISTAMMRSWENRPDTFVCDEPLYAHYLTRRDPGHPGVDQVKEHHECDWRQVVSWLTGPIPDGKPVFYQKHMTHHLLPEIDRGWMKEVVSCFLIRDPEEMLTSLLAKMDSPTLDDTGLLQQVEIFERVCEETGGVPPVIDAEDVLKDPRGTLTALCRAIGLEFTDAMLEWPKGRRASDGIWAEYWYASVEASTGFRPYQPKDEQVPDEYRALLDTCREHYQKLHSHRLRGDG